MTTEAQIYQSCLGEDAYAQRMALEYAYFAGVYAQYYVLRDQVERQPPGPGPDHDELYGEPINPIDRPETDAPESKQTWNFKDPVEVRLVITSLTDDRQIVKGGSTLTRTLQGAMAALDAAKISSCTPTIEEVDAANVVSPGGSPKPGDVMFVGGRYQQWFDIDTVQPAGFLRPGSTPTSYDLSLVRRSKFYPERKDLIPGKSSFPTSSEAGTGV